jgi:hypothetical protein
VYVRGNIDIKLGNFINNKKKVCIYSTQIRTKIRIFFPPVGGTSESEPMLSHTVRKHLRKTRLELLHKEYEVNNN